CSVFSTLYKKDFFTFKRYTKNTKQSTNSRIDNLFELLGITGRLLNGDENIKECISLKTDFEKVDKNLEKIRDYSFDYLRKALNINDKN
ncbi:MAG: polysaccharide pyruvyl transferase family protein, partial [Clostridia bacterium]